MQLEPRMGPNNVLLAQVKGKRLDAQTAVAFKQEMLAWISSFEQMRNAQGNRPESGPIIVLNLEGVAFIDSSGIGALVSLFKKIGRNGEMALCGVAEIPMASFRLTRMDRVFRFFASEAEALEYYS